MAPKPVGIARELLATKKSMRKLTLVGELTAPKYDNCEASDAAVEHDYRLLRNEVNLATAGDRPIMYSICAGAPTSG